MTDEAKKWIIQAFCERYSPEEINSVCHIGIDRISDVCDEYTSSLPELEYPYWGYNIHLRESAKKWCYEKWKMRYSKGEIAKAVGIGRATVSTLLKEYMEEHKIRRKELVCPESVMCPQIGTRYARRLDRRKAEYIVRKYKEGYSARNIADAVNEKHTYISSLCSGIERDVTQGKHQEQLVYEVCNESRDYN